jgi:hypothetical protein
MTVEMETAPVTAWVPDMSTFGARLALIRQRMGWGNVKHAAEECGLPVQSWRSWERDGVDPTRKVEVAAKIAERTDCDYLWLVFGPSRGARRVSAAVTDGYERGHGRTVAKVTSNPNPTTPRTGLVTTRAVQQTRIVRSETRPVSLTAVG